MDKAISARTEYRMKEWREKIKEFRASGMTVKAWCETNGINIKTYYYWLRKIRVEICEKTETQAIIPVQIHSRETAAAVTVNLGNISVNISDGTSAETIAAVLDICRRIC